MKLHILFCSKFWCYFNRPSIWKLVDIIC